MQQNAYPERICVSDRNAATSLAYRMLRQLKKMKSQWSIPWPMATEAIIKGTVKRKRPELMLHNVMAFVHSG
ncbi:Uncharacterized protein BM_BM17669 [Brugia malayi]|uniref:Uncharacterized protein n=1 Tax=Brugia malayi TaxID=6279 RepID=A0A4E9FR50_BRUMA|nr:Uncharacterized protein BM_BM17669 [Brugia malayi]VIO97100.1 Uncharacterized protein BM_BM17669 [Brugia malayi]